MYYRAAEILPDGQIKLSDEALKVLQLSVGEHVALIPNNGRIIMRKLTQGDGMMTFEEFLLYRDIKLKSLSQEKVVRTLYSYLGAVTGNNRLLPDLLGRLLEIDSSTLTVPACSVSNLFNDTPPYADTDYFVQLSNNTRVYIYGKTPVEPLRDLFENEYVIIMLTDDLHSNIERKPNRHIYLQ